MFLPFLKRQILDSSMLKEFVDDNFKFDENGRKLSKSGKNTAEKGNVLTNRNVLTLSQQILDSSMLKEFVDDNFKFDENGRKLSKSGKNTAEKGEIAHYQQFLLF